MKLKELHIKQLKEMVKRLNTVALHVDKNKSINVSDLLKWYIKNGEYQI